MRLQGAPKRQRARAVFYESLTLGRLDSYALAVHCRLHLNRAHHASVLMFQDVAMIDEVSYDRGISKIHAEPYARIAMALAVPVGHVNRVAPAGFVRRLSVTIQNLKMQL